MFWQKRHRATKALSPPASEDGQNGSTEDNACLSSLRQLRAARLAIMAFSGDCAGPLSLRKPSVYPSAPFGTLRRPISPAPKACCVLTCLRVASQYYSGKYLLNFGSYWLKSQEDWHASQKPILNHFITLVLFLPWNVACVVDFWRGTNFMDIVEGKTRFWRLNFRVAVISAKNHKRQRRKRQSVTAKRKKSQTPKVLTAILTLPNLT